MSDYWRDKSKLSTLLPTVQFFDLNGHEMQTTFSGQKLLVE